MQTENSMTTERKTPYNSTFSKGGVSCFYDSEVLNSNHVLLFMVSAKNTRLRAAANRWRSCLIQFA